MARLVLLALVFLHGAFAAGMVPVLNQQLGATAPRAFALYFAAMVAGQGAMWLVAALSRPRAALALYELLFAGAILGMALVMTALGFLVGRVVEGLGSGLTLPLIFAAALRLEGGGTPESRIAATNSSFALGFVSGPLAFEAVHRLAEVRTILLGYAGAFAACALGAWLFLRTPPATAAAEVDASRLEGGLSRFWPLCLAKLTYGFTFALLGGHAKTLFGDVPLGLVMLGLAGVFVVGQVAASLIVRRFGTGPLLRVAPLVLALGAAGVALTDRGALVFVCSLGHSALILAGYRVLSVSGDVRVFALWNAATDPALLLGSLLAFAGPQGAAGLSALGLVSLFLPVPAAPPPVEVAA